MVISKQPRKCFKSTAFHRAIYSLEVIYSDIYRPLKVPTLGECRYFISFVDEFTRNIWEFVISRKSDYC